MVHTSIVADIGINHGGNVKTALNLIDACAWIGVDVVKFQTVNADLVYKKDNPLYAIFKKNELSLNDWILLRNRATELGLEFMSTPGDFDSVDLLDAIGVQRFKIASDSASNATFVNHVFGRGKPVIVSTGMSTTDEIFKIMTTEYKSQPQYLLHCVSKYPTQTKDANLRRITTFKKKLKLLKWNTKVGYSDHVQGHEASLAAVALGAELIEKHIKWNEDCVDAAVSLSPIQFHEMILKIRQLEQML